jgi:hypothetical protein
MSKWELGNHQILETNRKIGISSYLSIITIDVNTLTFLIKRHRLAVWIKHKLQLFDVCKKHTSLSKVYTDWKWKDWKWYFK